MATAQKSITLNGVAVNELFSTIEAVKTTPSIAKFKFRIRNQWEDGSRNHSTVTTLSGATSRTARASGRCATSDCRIRIS